MTNSYRIQQVEKPEDPLWEAVGGGIHHYNIQQAGESLNKDVCFALYDSDNRIVGGMIGNVHWGWLYINLFFIKEELRGQGYGHQILTLAEEEARKLGATHAYLDTFSFQAPGFYEKHGYQVFGVLSDFPEGHQRYYYTKQL